MGQELLEGLGYSLAILAGLAATFGAFIAFGVWLIRNGDIWRYGPEGQPEPSAFDEIAAAFDGPSADRDDDAGRGAA